MFIPLTKNYPKILNLKKQPKKIDFFFHISNSKL